MSTNARGGNQSLMQFRKRAGAGAVALLLLLPSAARGGGVVTECTEASLRAAMTGGGTVTFACDGTLRLANTITISLDTVLDATGRQVTISGGGAVRVFCVCANATLTLVNLTIANGTGYGGGGILNSGGTVNATRCAFSGNTASNGNQSLACGGAILNQSGLIQLLACDFAGNQARANLDASGYGGTSAGGGAIYNGGTAVLDLCMFTGNSASGAPGTWQMGLTMGGSASGGAIFNNGTLEVRRSTLTGNGAVGGAGGPGGNGRPWMDIATDGGAGGPGGQGAGGALFNGGTAIAVNSTFAANFGGGGPGGMGGTGGTGQRIGGNGGFGGTGGTGVGGAMRDTSGLLRLTNCTVAFNGCGGGPGGPGGMGGGHLFSGGWDGGPGSSGMNGVAAGGGLNSSGSAWVNTLLAANSPGNCSGEVFDAGHNLSSDGTCAFTNTSSLNNTDPKLGPLTDNGGPTFTLALLPGSPAIDAGDTRAAPPTDQRGGARPAGLAADIGAYEYGAMPALQITAPVAGSFDVLLHEVTAPSCRLLTSTNFSSWLPIATNQIGADGTALFHVRVDTADVQRFYRVASP